MLDTFTRSITLLDRREVTPSGITSMTNSRTGAVLRDLHQLVAAHGADHRPDHELVERFVAHHAEDALAALMQRHGPMVWRVCHQVLRHAQDAEDAFQATFLVL